MNKLPIYSQYIDHWSLDQDIVFLNHGSFGATPKYILEKQSEYRDLMEKEPVDFFVNIMPDILHQSKSALADFVGASPNDMVFAQNTTTGVNQILASFPYEQGDEWLVTSHAYGACTNAIKHFAKRNKINLNIAEIPFPVNDEITILKSIEKKITKNTKLALIDHITSASGMIFPVEKIIHLLHSHNIKVIIDGAHVPGMIDLNIKKLNPDFYIGNCHKWLCAPKGSAFIYVRNEYKKLVKPLVISHFNDTDLKGESHWSNQFMWDGTHDFSQYLCVKDTIDFMDSIHSKGWEGIIEHNHNLVWKGANLIADKIGAKLPLKEKFIGSIINIPMPDGKQGFPKFNETSALKKVLFEKYKIEVPIFFFPTEPKQWIRLSAQLYNSLDQYDYLGDCLVKEFKTN